MKWFKGDYREAAQNASRDEHFSESQRMALAEIANPISEEASSKEFGTGRVFYAFDEAFVFHASSEGGTNIFAL